MDDTEILQPGQRFGRYEIVRVIGRGGMGAVYEARHSELNKPVALKTLLGSALRDPAAIERFMREGRAASSVQHPHVADVVDFGVEAGSPFLVMELLNGESLGALVERRGALPVEQIASILVPVIAAVHAAHEAGVIHRDLKPENVFLARERKGSVTPKVLDFGISKFANDTSKRLTQTGSVLGTPQFMPPEQARGSNHVTPLWDQYAIGVMLYECATGRLPFDDENFLALVQLVLVGECERPRAIRPELPVAFESIVMRAMHVDPAKRFPDLVALGSALLPYADAATQAVFAHEFDGALGNDGPTSVDLKNIPSLALDLPTISVPRHPTTVRHLSVEVPSVRRVAAPRSRWRMALVAVAVVLGIGGGIAVAQWSVHATRTHDVRAVSPTTTTANPSVPAAAPNRATPPPRVSTPPHATHVTATPDTRETPTPSTTTSTPASTHTTTGTTSHRRTTTPTHRSQPTHRRTNYAPNVVY